MKFVLLRKAANLTQADVAKKIGVAQSTVAMWESGENMPRADKLLLLANLYGCTIDELLRDGEEVG